MRHKYSLEDYGIYVALTGWAIYIECVKCKKKWKRTKEDVPIYQRSYVVHVAPIEKKNKQHHVTNPFEILQVIESHEKEVHINAVR